jgi:putative aldouronate transport system permease protein
MNRLSMQDRIIVGSSYIYLTIFALLCIVPFISIISASLTSKAYLDFHGFQILPHDFSLKAYEYIFTGTSTIGKSYIITVSVTVIGTIISMLVTASMAYALSRKELKYANHLSFFVYFTMLFSGGIVPWFIVMTNYLHLTDNLWGLILPYTVNAWNMFLLKNFFSTIDSALLESARIDGANEWTIMYKIVMPLIIPGVMTIGLFYALQYWNDWWLALLLLNDKELYPIQYLLKMIMSTVEYISQGGQGAKYASSNMPSEGIKMATTVVTIGPIVFLYPFIQKYFIKGLTVGGVKG